MCERWLVTGASGRLGGHVLRALRRAGGDREVVAVGRATAPGVPTIRADLTDGPALAHAVGVVRPTHIIHLAGLTSPAACAADPVRARRCNTGLTRRLAEHAEAHGAWLLYTSTDFVFGGEAGAAYVEGDEAAPTTLYGRTKLEAEDAVLASGGAVVRLSLLYGISARPTATSVFERNVDRLRRGEPVPVVVDEWRTPLWLADAARIIVALSRERHRGLLHAGGPERMTSAEAFSRIAEIFGVVPTLVPLRRHELSPAHRPRDVSLDSRLLLEGFPEVTPHVLSPVTIGSGPHASARRRLGALEGG